MAYEHTEVNAEEFKAEVLSKYPLGIEEIS